MSEGKSRDNGVLWEDPDGEFSITEDDVEMAIREAGERVGPEFEALLRAEAYDPKEGEGQSGGVGGEKDAHE